MNLSFIRVEELRKTFPSGKGELPVLNGISLTIERGEILAIVGASGAGKSTFLHVLGTLERPTSGRVLYEQNDIFQFHETALSAFRNRTVGFVFQFHHLLPEFTALENAMLPGLIRRMDGEEAMDRGKRLLDEVGLGDRLHHRPGELSGGEQQRVAVARALLLEPRVVLADEPTGNLDTRTAEEVFRLLRDLNRKRGITLVFVTHNEALSHQADRIARMVDGQIVEVRVRQTP
ncbi:MAG: ABC transporter ATP-binding protein [Nitrospirae bacterium]|nr:ABC transporter ATP-binding protein [Nitrospirota bacterium]